MTDGKPIGSLDELEEQIESSLESIGKRLPLQIVLERVRYEEFEKDGESYYARFNVNRVPYLASVTHNGLALWRIHPRSHGTQIVSYADSQVLDFYRELEERRDYPQTQTTRRAKRFSS